jgi:hypothetical protein
MNFLRTCFAAVLICVATACCSSANQAGVVAQPEAPIAIGGIILKPKVAVADESAVAKIVSAQLATPEQVKFLRAMSGGAYVFKVYPPASKADIPAIVARLIASGLFEYVEEDRVMTIRQ